MEHAYTYKQSLRQKRKTISLESFFEEHPNRQLLPTYISMDTYNDFCQRQILEPLNAKMKGAGKGLGSKRLIEIMEEVMNSPEVTQVLIKAFESAPPKTKSKALKEPKQPKVKAEGAKPRSPNWQNLWAAKDRGGRAAFPEDYDRIKKSLGDKVSHFVVLSQLRDLKEQDGGWKQWWEALAAKGENVPKEPPTVRKTGNQTDNATLTTEAADSAAPTLSTTVTVTTSSTSTPTTAAPPTSPTTQAQSDAKVKSRPATTATRKPKAGGTTKQDSEVLCSD